MRKCVYFFLLFGLIFTIFNCTKQVNTVDRQPSSVFLIPGVDDTCRVERGIDAVPEGNVIRIEWIPSSEEEVTGYEIYRGVDDKTGPYNLIAGLTVLTVTDSFFVDGPVSLNKRYYYYILAVTYDDDKSAPSDTLDYQLIQKAANLLPRGETNDSRPDFSWEDPNSPPKAYYVVRLVEVASGDIIWISLVPSSYNPNRETVLFNGDGTATADSLFSSIDYQWRVDIRGSEDHSGSESNWVALRLQ